MPSVAVTMDCLVPEGVPELSGSREAHSVITRFRACILVVVGGIIPRRRRCRFCALAYRPNQCVDGRHGRSRLDRRGQVAIIGYVRSWMQPATAIGGLLILLLALGHQQDSPLPPDAAVGPPASSHRAVIASVISSRNPAPRSDRTCEQSECHSPHD